MSTCGNPKVSAIATALAASLLTLAPLVTSAANLALSANGGVASQSSTMVYTVPGTDYSIPGTASKAIDGDVNGDFFAGSVTHTNRDLAAWWQVTLAEIGSISDVVVYNRTDYGGDRLSPFNLELLLGANIVQSFSNQTFAADITGTNVAGMTFQVDGTVADAVRIQLVGTNKLSLAEVVVNGTPLPPISTPLPAAVWLMGSALAGLGAIARRRRPV